MNSAAQYLGTELERLMAMPLANPVELKNWYSECAKVQEELQRQFPQFEPAEEVWHFFADADVRSRDAGYRDRQHRIISNCVKDLRHEKQTG